MVGESPDAEGNMFLIIVDAMDTVKSVYFNSLKNIWVVEAARNQKSRVVFVSTSSQLFRQPNASYHLRFSKEAPFTFAARWGNCVGHCFFYRSPTCGKPMVMKILPIKRYEYPFQYYHVHLFFFRICRARNNISEDSFHIDTVTMIQLVFDVWFQLFFYTWLNIRMIQINTYNIWTYLRAVKTI